MNVTCPAAGVSDPKLRVLVSRSYVMTLSMLSRTVQVLCLLTITRFYVCLGLLLSTVDLHSE